MAAYKGRYFMRERVYVCGEYLDADIYPVFQAPGKRRDKCRPSSEIQQKLNARNSERRALRVVHSNFTPDDLYLTMTYAVEPADEYRAARDAYNYLCRVKRRRAARGLPELKYVYAIERGSENGRIHIHVILSGGMDRDELEQLWKKGRANCRRLQFGEDGLAGLVHYIRKDRVFYKTWSQSRNLVMPEAQVRDGVITVAEAEALADAIDGSGAWDILEERYAGYSLVNAECSRNSVNGAEYIRVEMWADPRWRYQRARQRAREDKQCSVSRGVYGLAT